jgi:NADH-quinone oxidoreductase subunit L
MFWIPIIIANITPLYMMRCWWLTFCGKPRDEHVYHHAHEQWKMYLPLVILALGTVFCSYSTFRPLIADAAAKATSCPTIVAFDGEAKSIEEAGKARMLMLNHEKGRNPHEALVPIVGFAWIVGMGIAWLIYRKGLAGGDWFKKRFSLIHTALVQKLYFDHIYNTLLVGGTILLGRIAGMFDKIIIDGAVNLAAFFTRSIGIFTGRQLDMAVEQRDLGLVDAVANGIAAMMLDIGMEIRRPQSGRIRTYVLLAVGATAVVLLFVLFFDQIAAGYKHLFAAILPVCEG